MAEVDTSIYKQTPRNPLDDIAKLGGALDVAGNIQVGKAVQGSIGPDGQIDRSALSKLLTQSQAGAMKAIPTMDALEKLRSAGFQADQAGLDTLQKRMGLVNHLISPLASKKNPTKDDVLDTAARALDPAFKAHEVGITIPVLQGYFLKQFKDSKGNWLPPDKIRQRALDMQTQAASTAEILHQHSPRGRWVDQGGQYTFIPEGTANNPALGTAVPTGLPPGAVEYPPGGGQPAYRGQQPAIPGGGAVVPGGAPAVPGTGPRSQGTAPAAAQPPGYPEVASASGKQMANDRARAGSFAGELFPLNQALDSLERLGTKGTGPGTEEFNNVKSFLASNAPTWLPGEKSIDLQKIKDFDEAKKYLTAAAVNRASTFGHGTDSQLATTLAANPNMKISNLAAVDLTKATIALRRMDQAMILDADRQGVNPDKYSQFAGKWATTQDPRAYYVDLLNPKQFEELKKKIKPGTAEARKFNASLKAAIDNGIVVPINAGQRGQQ